MNRDYGKAKSAASGPRSYGKVTRMADGEGVEEAQMKQEGLAASNRDLANEKPADSFFGRVKQSLGRLTEGSIDDPNSVAYHKYGAGRGRIEAGNKAQADNELDMAASLSRGADKKPEAPKVEDKEDEYESRIAARAASTTPKQESAATPKAAAKPSKPVASAAAPASAPATPRPTSNYGNEGRGKEKTRASMDKQIAKEFDDVPLNRAVKAVTSKFRSEGPSMGDMVGVRKGNQSNRYYGLTGKRLTAEDDPRVVKKANGGMVGKKKC